MTPTDADLQAAVAEGLSVRETARRFGLSKGQVSGRLCRIRAKWHLMGPHLCTQRHPDRRAMLIELEREGASNAEMALALGVSLKGVSAFKTRLRLAGLLPAREGGAPRKTVVSAAGEARRMRMFWNEARVAQAVALRRSGKTLGQVAQRMGCSAVSVSVHTAEACRDMIQARKVEAAAVELRQHPAKAIRRCLGGCNQVFPSAGPHHRVCNGCRQSDEWTGGYLHAGYTGASLGC